MSKYRNTLDKMLEGLNLINRPCFYQTKITKEIKTANIKEAELYLYPHGERRILCTLDNGQQVVMHCNNCPNYIGNNIWGFLTIAECEEYWDM